MSQENKVEAWELEPRPLLERIKTVEPWIPPRVAPRFILTYSGKKVTFNDTNPETIVLEDIYHALARINRYTGQGERFYSVAEHSVRLSHAVHPALAFQALIHDAHEAYTGDVSSPLKQHLNDYRVVENMVEQTLRRKFMVWDELNPDIKWWDLEFQRIEQHILFNHLREEPGWESLYPWLTGAIDPDFETNLNWRHKQLAPVPCGPLGWDAGVAEYRFRVRWEELWEAHSQQAQLNKPRIKELDPFFHTSSGVHLHHASHGP